MVVGKVNGRGEAILSLRVRAPSGTADIAASALLDTGFSGALSLPATTIATLGLPRQLTRSARLGDGTVRQIDLFAAEIEWAGTWRPILVHQVGREVLVGAMLLNGFRSPVDWVPGGTVDVLPLPP